MTPEECEALANALAPLVHWIGVVLAALGAGASGVVGGRLWERHNLDDQAKRLRSHWIGVLRIREDFLIERYGKQAREKSREDDK